MFNKTVDTYKKRLKKYDKKLENVRYHIDRKVKDIYESNNPTDEHCTIILLSGNQKGKYWTMKEYKDDNK